MNVGVRRVRKLRGVGFVLHHPLIDKAIEQLRFVFRFSIDQHLVTAEMAHIALKNYVIFHACSDPIDRFLLDVAGACGIEGLLLNCKDRGESRLQQNSREHEQHDRPRQGAKRARCFKRGAHRHQKLDPRLKKI